MLLIGYVLQRTLLERSLRSGLLVPLLTTFGLSIVIQNLLEQGFSPDDRSLGAQRRLDRDRELADHEPALDLGDRGADARCRDRDLRRPAACSSRGPSAGRQMRATAQDPDTAELVGIDSRAVYARATAIAVAIAAIGGMFLAIRSSFYPVLRARPT